MEVALALTSKENNLSQEVRRLLVTETEKGKLHFHAYGFTGGSRGKCEFLIKTWEGMRKMRNYSAVCTETASENAPPFCGEKSPSFKSRC